MSGDSQPKIELVVAMARNRVIGRDGDLPWRVSSDLKRFRALTLGKPVIMGRKTFASIGKPLDQRDNIVVTRDQAFSADGVTVVHSLEDALAVAAELAEKRGADAISVIGGAEIYRQTLEKADIVHVSLIDLAPEGDAAFPLLDPAEWEERVVGQQEAGSRDDAGFTMIEYHRRL